MMRLPFSHKLSLPITYLSPNDHAVKHENNRNRYIIMQVQPISWTHMNAYLRWNNEGTEHSNVNQSLTSSVLSAIVRLLLVRGIRSSYYVIPPPPQFVTSYFLHKITIIQGFVLHRLHFAAFKLNEQKEVRLP